MNNLIQSRVFVSTLELIAITYKIFKNLYVCSYIGKTIFKHWTGES